MTNGHLCETCSGNGVVEVWSAHHPYNWELTREIRCPECCGSGRGVCVMCGEPRQVDDERYCSDKCHADDDARETEHQAAVAQ